MMTRARQGFTLVEISIVLIAIGLLSGAILVGISLVRNSQMISIKRDVDRFSSAVNSFRGKYGCLPGDCDNATQFFGSDAGNCAQGTTPTGTCNGDGNNQISLFSVYGAGGPLSYINERESFLAWQQLALAGFIDGQYSGTSDTRDVNNPNGRDMNRASIVGKNVPPSRITGAGYQIVWMDVNYPVTPFNLYDRWPASGHWIFFGNPLTDPYYTSSGLLYEPGGGAITPADAKSIDAKFDDGAPHTGKILTVFTNLRMPDCVDVSSGTPKYNIKKTTASCGLQFQAGF